MSNHYFTEKPSKKFTPRIKINFFFNGQIFTFWTCSGIFSPKDIDPGTKILLKYLHYPCKGNFLDVGAGYGVIGIILLFSSPDARGTFIEINPSAAKLIRKNLIENKCPKAEIIVGDFLQHKFIEKFDYIVCNPPIKRGLKYVEQIIDKISLLLNEGGLFQFVVKTKLGGKRLRDYVSLEHLHFTSISEEIKAGYRVITCQRS